MKKIKHIGVYGIIMKGNQIVLIKKKGGPYDGKLDLPGGTIEFNETVEEALVRELKEELDINVLNYCLLDVVSFNIKWTHKGELEEIKHIALLYKINNFENEIKGTVEIDDKKNDSKGAGYYKIENLEEDGLSTLVRNALTKINVK